MGAGKPFRPSVVRRFVVAEDSMLPSLRPGDGLVAVRSRRARPGQIRVFEHPGRPDFWLVKRVGSVSGARFEAVSDHPEAGAVDSRAFGPVETAGSYRVVFRVRGGGAPRRRTAADSAK